MTAPSSRSLPSWIHGDRASSTSSAIIEKKQPRRRSFPVHIKYLCVAAMFQFGLNYIYVHRLVHNADNQNSNVGSIRSHNHDKGRVFVCITGQISRSIIGKQMETLLLPLQQEGYDLDLALVLAPDNAFDTTNKKTRRAGTKEYGETYQDLINYLYANLPATTAIVTAGASPTLFEQESDPDIPPEYVERMFQRKVKRGHPKTDAWHRNRAQNHARIFKSKQQCYHSMTNHFMRMLQQQDNHHQQPTDYYDAVIRVREDMALSEPVAWDKLISFLKRRRNTILGSDCRTWDGINDRFHIVGVDAAKEYFMAPYDHFYDSGRATIFEEDTRTVVLNHTGSTIRPLHPKIENPETYLYYTYQQHGIDIVNTPDIRGVDKYIAANDADINNDPEAATAVVVSEKGKYCPNYLKSKIQATWNEFMIVTKDV